MASMALALASFSHGRGGGFHTLLEECLEDEAEAVPCEL